MADSLAQMAARLGLRCSQAVDAKPWDADSQARYVQRHADRSTHGYSALPDAQIAGIVRMLMRDELDHEAVVQAARDRICALIEERDSVRDALALILPLAKGYAPEGQTASARRTCNGWIESAEQALALSAPSPPQPNTEGA